MRELMRACLLPALFAHATAFNMRPAHSTALFVTDSLDGWLKPESHKYKGLLLRRTINAWDDGKIDGFGGIALAGSRIGGGSTLRTTVELKRNFETRLSESVDELESNLETRLSESVDELLGVASLPEALSEQIRSDACSIGCTVGSMCPTARELELNLEIIGENTCARWHKDAFMGRAIVSYTGAVGTEYSHDSNVDLWELHNGGTNDRIILDEEDVESVSVGDILFIKGSRFPYGEAGLVHKSPARRYHKDGRIVNRLLLKVDVLT